MTTKEGMPRMLGRESLAFPARSVSHRPTDLWWEGRGPTDIADRVDASMPTFITEELSKRITTAIADADKCVPLPVLV